MPLLRTARLDLVPGRPADLVAELDGRAALARSLGIAVPDSWPPALFDEPAIRWTLAQLEEHPEHADWGFYYLARREDDGRRHLVGAGGFKGGPDASGAVEIGYSLVPEHQGHGYATEAAREWVRFAFASPRVTLVRAHTLTSGAASIRVLERVGFTRAGEATDPDVPDEPVVRWKLLRPPA